MHENDATTIEGGIPPRHNVIQPLEYYTWRIDFVGTDFTPIREFRNVANDEEMEAIEDAHPNPIGGSSPMRALSSSNRYIQFLPLVPLPTTLIGNASLNNHEAIVVYISHIFIMKEKLRDKLGLTTLKNHFQFNVSKLTTHRFEAKCIVKGCKWRIRVIRTITMPIFDLHV